MSLIEQSHLAHVTYRANLAGGREVEIRIKATPAAATLTDAWSRLSALYPEVDPRSIEIEIREPGTACPPKAVPDRGAGRADKMLGPEEAHLSGAAEAEHVRRIAAA